jgi:diguanylate cyclase (GGDEF)-like protein
VIPSIPKILLLLTVIAVLAVLGDMNSTIISLASYWIAVAGGVFLVLIWQHKTNNRGATLAINDIRDSIVITKSDGLITGINSEGRKFFAESVGKAKTIEELFKNLHAHLESPEEASTTLQTILQAPTITYQDILNTKDGNTYKRKTHPIEGGESRIWYLRDISQQKAAAHDQELGNALLEKYAEETAEIAEQLYLTKGELELQQEKLKHLANTDMMTGLCNRHHFLARAGEHILSNPNEIRVLMLDLDHFKTVNDTYGHAAGDQVIKTFAEIITRIIPENSLAGRVGGEEFAVVIPDATLEKAVADAESIRLLTVNNITTVDGNDIHFTCSIGVASYRPAEDTIERALDRSDKALYVAKKNGRNQVKVYRD